MMMRAKFAKHSRPEHRSTRYIQKPQRFLYEFFLTNDSIITRRGPIKSSRPHSVMMRAKPLETRTHLQLNEYLENGTVGKHYSNILILLLRLHQACCHPQVSKDYDEYSATTELTMEEPGVKGVKGSHPG